jgi:hypothetical protein
MCPLAHADGHDAPRLIDEIVPGKAAVVDDVVIGFEDAVRVRIASPEMLPSVVVLPHLKCSRRWLGGEDEESQHGDAERIG